MTIQIGPMQLWATEPLDNFQGYVNGLTPDANEWTNWTRLSAHDHSGGLNGVPITTYTPPAGSITSGMLDPSVLAPYALTDGSKPFTGQVTMQADAVVRDAILFGEQGTALAPDVSLTRTSSTLLTLNSGLYQTGGAYIRAQTAFVSTFGGVSLGFNTYYDPAAGGWRNLDAAQTGMFMRVDATSWAVTKATSGASPTITALASINPTGTLTLSPVAGQPAIVVPDTVGSATSSLQSSGQLTLRASSGHIWLNIPAANSLVPAVDNTNTCGHGSFRWSIVYAYAGAINTSSRAAKQDITPLDPAAAMGAVRATEAVTFDYRAPERPPEWYDLPDDPEAAEQELLFRLRGEPLEAAARHQAGFVSEQAHPLFVTGEGQTNPSNSIGILLAALQHLDARLTALEAP